QSPAASFRNRLPNPRASLRNHDLEKRSIGSIIKLSGYRDELHTSALDVSVQAQILNLMRRLQKELGLTYLFISHDLSVVRHMSDMIAVMYLGRIVEMAPVEALFSQPLHPYSQLLLNTIPDIHAPKRDRCVDNGEPPSPLKPPAGCAFHPRCALATEACRETVPPLRPISDGHQAACLLAG
ncbi:ABC transporter ATP-binding protein, partial [Leisingera sp.]|uniref:ABC transporter ATP-binding protein n=1 Tax=Leisingera sp. TaxID=1879318 RepID=UPI002B267F6E